MDVKALNLLRLFTEEIDKKFYIPEFQRPYVWSIDNCEELWEDLVDAFDEYQQNKEFYQNYFLGPIVLVKQNDDKYYIVDGQQRLTTFTILFWYIFPLLENNDDKYNMKLILTICNDEERPRLIVSSQNQSLYHYAKDNQKINDSKEPFAVAANYFYDKVNNFSQNKSISDFFNFIIKKTEFIKIVTSNFETAWDLFIGLNSKGEALNPADLIKAFVCGNSVEGANDIWNGKVANLRDYSTSYLLFLTRYKSKEFLIEKNLYKKFTENYNTKISLIDLQKYAGIYTLFWETELNEIPNGITENLTLSSKAIRSLLNLRYLNRRDITVLIFLFADMFGLTSIFDDKFLHILESFEIKMAISRKKSHERKITVNSSKMVINLDKNEALKQIAAMLNEFILDDQNVKSYVTALDYGSSIGRLILKNMELKGRGILTDLSPNINIEHVMPVKHTEYWWKISNCKTEIEYDRLINNIGNLFIIDNITNNEIKNADFTIKKNAYKEYLKNCTIVSYTQNLTKWTPDSIKRRADEIADFVVSNWSLI